MAFRNHKNYERRRTQLTFLIYVLNCRATVHQDSITAYNDLKLNKKFKYIIYKLDDANKNIVVDSTSEDGDDYESFRDKLVNATTKSKTVRAITPFPPLVF